MNEEWFNNSSRIVSEYARKSADLSVWTICKGTSDYPDKITCRRHVVNAMGNKPTEDLLISDDIENIRKVMMNCGLLCMARHPADDAVIVESWF